MYTCCQRDRGVPPPIHPSHATLRLWLSPSYAAPSFVLVACACAWHGIAWHDTISLRVEWLRTHYQAEIGHFVKHGSSLLENIHKTKPAEKNSEKVKKLAQYVKEGENVLRYLNRCDNGHVPSAKSLPCLEHTITRVDKASNELQVRDGVG